MRVALFGRRPKDEDIIYVQNLINQIEQNFDFVFIHEKFYNKIKEKVCFSKPLKLFNTKEELINGADILLSLGGDGTFLDTLPIVKDSQIPIIGINLGHLGFLTSVGRNGLENLIEELKQKKFNIENHSLLMINDKDLGIEDKYALNDICLRSSKAGDILDIDIFVDDEFLATYTADGVIITTPTGSTAYNMSAGGPIISPKSSCIGITPICPHNLTFRPIIIPDSSKLRLEVAETSTSISLHMDSLTNEMKPPFSVTINKAEFKVKVIRMHNQSFYTAIRNKLMWGTSIRQR
ncbi:MAG: ATP-NAD/AcoX kinase [Bacteroidetes bacterium]|nr:ATP-NAD/AcoX kinase [Bacteroidota bacterium]